MTCSILSAIIASMPVMSAARKPPWRNAAKDCFAGALAAGGGAADAGCGASFTRILPACAALFRDAHLAEYRDDLGSAAGPSAERDCANALERGEIVMRRARAGRPLVGIAMDAEARGKAV